MMREFPVVTTSFAACWTILALSAAFKFDELVSTASWGNVKSWIILFGIIVTLLTCVWLRQRGGISSLVLLAFVFSGFAIYHWINVGKPCGCFGQFGKSTFPMALGTGLISLSCILGSAMAVNRPQHLKSSSATCLIILIAGIVIGAVSLLRSNRESRADVTSLCSLTGNRQPFLRVSNFLTSFHESDWIVLVLRSDCPHCMAAAKVRVAAEEYQMIEQFQPEYFVLFRPEGGEHSWSRYNLSILSENPDGQLWVPVTLVIRNGIVHSCSTKL